MATEKSFGTRLLQAAKKGKYKPGVFLPVLEDMEEMLLRYESEQMSQKDLPMDEKGRIACTINFLVMGVRERKAAIAAANSEETKQEPLLRLHNTHLQ